MSSEPVLVCWKCGAPLAAKSELTELFGESSVDAADESSCSTGKDLENLFDQ